MTPTPDVFALLAAADPARRTALFEPASPQGRAVLARAYAMEPAVEPVAIAGRRRRRRVVAVAVAAAVAAAAAAAWISSRQPTHTLNVGCYAEARLDASTLVVDARPGQAVEACAQVWREGAFGSAAAASPPSLAACTLSTGAVGVFPGGPAACARLGLPVTQTTRPGPDRVGAVQARLHAAAASSACLPPAQARTTAEDALADAGLSDWRVTGTGFTEARPCATYVFDEANKRVGLVPSPPR
jgi:hypothetical protein